MTKERIGFRSFMPRSVLRCVQITALSALTLSLQPGIPYAALAQALYDGENSAEGWAWSKIKAQFALARYSPILFESAAF